MSEDESKPLRLNEPAPDFLAAATTGFVQLVDFAGRWLVLFSYVNDFTPVCTSEVVAFAERAKDFEKRGVKLVGLSADGIHAHIAWLNSDTMPAKIPFPIIADLEGEIARAYGMVHPASPASGVRSRGPVRVNRCTFVIDPAQNVRAMIHYPMTVGRSVEEILRVVDALMYGDETGLNTLANWKAGEKGVAPPPTTIER
jgi:peroxiredoxin (alkyl hydroperoxide reductase subunit C)